jgi:hypothetical protein
MTHGTKASAALQIANFRQTIGKFGASAANRPLSRNRSTQIREAGLDVAEFSGVDAPKSGGGFVYFGFERLEFFFGSFGFFNSQRIGFFAQLGKTTMLFVLFFALNFGRRTCSKTCGDG